jgi:hypothetical protein
MHAAIAGSQNRGVGRRDRAGAPYPTVDRDGPKRCRCSVMRDDVFIQEAVGRADTMLTSARAFVFEVMGDVWTTPVNGREPTSIQVAHFTTAHSYVVGACVGATRLQGGRRHGSLSKGIA